MSRSRHLRLLGFIVPFSCVLVALLSGPVVDNGGGSIDAPPLLSNLLRRGLHITVALTPALAVAPVALFVPAFRALLFYPAISHGLRSSGALFIKWGQWAVRGAS